MVVHMYRWLGARVVFMTESYGRRTKLPMFEDVRVGFFGVRLAGLVTREVGHSLTVAVLSAAVPAPFQQGSAVPASQRRSSKVVSFCSPLSQGGIQGGCMQIRNLPPTGQELRLGKEGSHAVRETNLHQAEVLNALTAHPRYVYRIRRTRRMTRRPAEKSVA